MNNITPPATNPEAEVKVLEVLESAEEKEVSATTGVESTSPGRYTPSGLVLDWIRRPFACGPERLPTSVNSVNQRSRNFDVTVDRSNASAPEIKYQSVSRGKKKSVHQDFRIQLQNFTPNCVSLKIGRKTLKVLTFILQEANDKGVFDSPFTKVQIEIGFDRFIEKGLYSGKDQARRGLNKILLILRSMMWQGTVQLQGPSKKPKKYTQWRPMFFPSLGRGDVLIEFDDEHHIPREVLAQTLAWLPDIYYALSDNSAELLRIVFCDARAHAGNVVRKNRIHDINLRKIQTDLGLPDDLSASNPNKEIKDVIEDCLSEIEQVTGRHPDFKMTIYTMGKDGKPAPVPKYSHITDYLDNGFLRVEFPEEYYRHIADGYLKGSAKGKIREEKKKKQIESTAQNIEKSMQRSGSRIKKKEGQS